MDNLQQKNINVFDMIPTGFFNYLASNSNQRLYAECLALIYGQYEREISYRIPRNQIRDSLAIYLLENHVSLDADQETGPIKTHGELASAILRKFCSKNVGWLEEENDEATYEKQILMTERGILLAEFLAQLKKPEKEEYSGYIFNIYNTLRNTEQWTEHPYINGMKSIYQNARYLSKSLKRLSTFIRKVIEKMVNEETLESLTENLLEYFDGSFIREYSRLTKQQNIHIYRGYIKTRLDEMKEDTALLDRLALECAKEEGLEEQEAREQVEDMILSSRRFLTEDYDRIMKVIKHKINVYLQVAIGRARFLRNREVDERGNIEQTIRYIVEEMGELDWKEGLPDRMRSLFTFGTQEFQKKGIKTEVRVFAELIKELKDESWRAAIETFLGRKRFYIIVEGAYCEDAMRILQDKRLYRANVVITDKLPETGEEPGSMAELLSIPNIYARRYANLLLNGIHRCESLEELHEYPRGGLMKNGMLAKSYAVAMMDMKRTKFYLGADAIKLRLAQLKKEQVEAKNLLESDRDRLRETEERIRAIDAVDWKADRYDFGAPGKLRQNMIERDALQGQKEALENNPKFMAVMEEVNRAQEQYKEIQGERDEIVGDIRGCKDGLKQEKEKQKTIAGEIYEAEQNYEEMRLRFLELESSMLEEYQRLRSRSDSCLVIKDKTIQNLAAERGKCITEMENLQMAYARLAEIDLNRRGVPFIPFYRAQLKEISNVRLEEVSARLAEQAKTLESAFMNDFVAEINEMVLSARTEIDLINRELKLLPFGSDTYRFVMEEKADRKDFFRICRKMEELGSAEFYLAGSRMDEELEHDIQSFMNVILEEEDEEEYTDYRRYFTYDMRISTNQGDEEIEADLSRKQGSASNGEKQTPYFIILAASLMQCYPKSNCCVRLAFIDEAFSALSRERIEQMVRYFEENHFQVIYAAPPEKIGSIGTFIQSTVSLVITGRYTNMIEGLVKVNGSSLQ